MIPFSILDLSQVVEGGTVEESFRNTALMAQAAEKAGYRRYWLAEHHGMPAVASSATAVLIGHVGQATSKIRIGSGGIMLPNHAPLVIAEQFGTLAALFPGRVDLGLGRAPGTDMKTARALRRDLDSGAHTFPNDILELQRMFGPVEDGQQVLAMPGVNSNVPIWLLGSSLYSAHLAAALGLPYAFASHFAPDALMDAIAIYRERFQPSAELDRPYVMAGVMGVVADTDEEAKYHFTSAQLQFINLRRNARGYFPKPVASMDEHWTEAEKYNVEHTLQYAIVGSPKTAERDLTDFIRVTGIDELIISMPVADVDARLKSIELFAGLDTIVRKAA